MRWLNVTHPSTGGTARVSEAALPYHLRGGWHVVPDPEPPAAPADDTEPAADTGQAGESAAPDQPAAQKPRRKAGAGETEGGT